VVLFAGIKPTDGSPARRQFQQRPHDKNATSAGWIIPS
jgi:hypothetical protein